MLSSETNTGSVTRSFGQYPKSNASRLSWGKEMDSILILIQQSGTNPIIFKIFVRQVSAEHPHASFERNRRQYIDDLVYAGLGCLVSPYARLRFLISQKHSGPKDMIGVIMCKNNVCDVFACP